MDGIDVQTLTGPMFAVVDLDTGTVLGTRIVLVATYPGEFDGWSDTRIREHAAVTGESLYAPRP
jgi:hypothetical protein